MQRERRDDADLGYVRTHTGQQEAARRSDSVCFLGATRLGQVGAAACLSAPGHVCVGDSEGGLAGIYRAVITLAREGAGN